MRVIRSVALALALSLATSQSAYAGAWTPEPGHGYAKLWMKWLYGFSYIDGGGDAISYAPYNELFVATYGDIGLVDGLAAFWHIDLIRTFYLVDPTTDERSTHVAPGDPALGLRWRFWKLGRFVMGAEASVRAPLASDEPQQVVYTREAPYRAIGNLQIGAGVWNVGGNISWGYGFDRWYMAGSVGYQWRSHDFDDRILWSLEAGITLNERWGGRARAHGAYSIPTGNAPYPETPSGIGNGVSYTGFALEVDYEFIERWFVGLTLEGGLFYLRRQTGGPVLSLSVSTQF